MANPTAELEARIAQLQAESDIRRLKARYLNACDAKDLAAMRGCFTEDAEILYPPLGRFDLDGLMEIFERLAATTAVIDVHQGHNADIEIRGDEASATWSLGFSTYNPEDGSFRLLAGFYFDRYRKTPAGWRICYTESRPRTIVDGALAEGGLQANWVEKDNAVDG